MFGLSIVKTAELDKLKYRVTILEQELNPALDQLRVLQSKYANLTDQVQRNDKAVRVQLDALAKPEVSPLLTGEPKHVADPVGAWESKQRVLEQRLKSAMADVDERKYHLWSGLSNGTAVAVAGLKRQAQERVKQLKQDLYEHSTRKPVIVQNTAPSETAVFVRHKKYGTLGLLKGHHITILSKGNQLDVGDVILNATPAVVHEFWDILPTVDQMSFHL